MIILCGFGVSNYYNKLKLVLLERGIPFQERLIYPWQRDTYWSSSPIGKIPFIQTDEGDLSESQVILEYLEDRYPSWPLYPSGVFAKAKCRELIMHLELNAEWVARRLYKESFFSGSVSAETKDEVRERLCIGLEGVSRIASFSPYIAGEEFSAADCVAFMHFDMIRQTTLRIYGDDPLGRILPAVNGYFDLMKTRPHVQRVMADRDQALADFRALNVKYDG
jgi:glutathione S-transferase